MSDELIERVACETRALRAERTLAERLIACEPRGECPVCGGERDHVDTCEVGVLLRERDEQKRINEFDIAVANRELAEDLAASLERERKLREAAGALLDVWFEMDEVDPQLVLNALAPFAERLGNALRSSGTASPSGGRQKPGECDGTLAGERCELVTGHTGSHRVESATKPGMHHRWRS